jgi:hypothetical protein
MSLWVCPSCGKLYGNLYTCPACNVFTHLATEVMTAGSMTVAPIDAPEPAVPVSALRALLEQHRDDIVDHYNETWWMELAALCDAAERTSDPEPSAP